jgi:dephospho-CoA kinase
MRKYVLIGGIGSGKSTVSSLLAAHGAQCLDLDRVGHEVLLDPEVIDMLAKSFGDGVLDEEGKIDRRALAARAFETPAETVKLNAITQPRLIARAAGMLGAFEQAGCGLAVIEVSAYDGTEGVFAPLVQGADGVIAVVAPTCARAARAQAKGFAAEDVENRMSRQAKDEQRALWADYVIGNGGTLDELRMQVDDLWTEISA